MAKSVEIITIGDEILIGQTIDTNSAWMGQRLNEVGLEVSQIRSIADTEEAIFEALDAVKPETELVLLTGGLGPTKDDLTKHALTKYFDDRLIYSEETFQHIRYLFARFGRVPNELNKKQAELPEKAEILRNDMGTASGMRWKKNGCYYISMPGVPYEMRFIMDTHVLPWALQNLERGVVVHKVILTQGVPESELAKRIADWEEALPPFIKLAYLPSPGMVKLRLTARGTDEEMLRNVIAHESSKVHDMLGNVIFGEDSDSIEELVGKMLIKQRATLCLAESCTGGTIGHMLTKIPGCSRYFLGGTISYANEIKTSLLSVNPGSLQRDGAVSQEVVEQMALGAKKLFGATYALSTSGVAGPDGGTEHKPVGMVWIGLAGPENEVISEVFHFGSNRHTNIKKSALAALDMLRKKLMERSEN